MLTLLLLLNRHETQVIPKLLAAPSCIRPLLLSYCHRIDAPNRTVWLLDDIGKLLKPVAVLAQAELLAQIAN